MYQIRKRKIFCQLTIAVIYLQWPATGQIFSTLFCGSWLLTMALVEFWNFVKNSVCRSVSQEFVALKCQICQLTTINSKQNQNKRAKESETKFETSISVEYYRVHTLCCAKKLQRTYFHYRLLLRQRQPFQFQFFWIANLLLKCQQQLLKKNCKTSLKLVAMD